MVMSADGLVTTSGCWISAPVGVAEGFMAQKESVARPWWVKLTLWGLPNRFSALIFVWFCVTLATAFVMVGFRDRRFSWGAVWLMPALGYLRAIRWVDKHGGWS